MEDLKEIIIEQIKNNKLESLNYDLVINQLEVLNNKSYDVIKANLDSLINSGKIHLKGMSTEKKWQPKQNKPKYDRSGNAPKSPYGNNYHNDSKYRHACGNKSLGEYVSKRTEYAVFTRKEVCEVLPELPGNIALTLKY